MQLTSGFARDLVFLPPQQSTIAILSLLPIHAKRRKWTLLTIMESRPLRRKFSKPPVKLACLSWYHHSTQGASNNLIDTNKPQTAVHCESAAMARIPAPIVSPKAPIAAMSPVDEEDRAIARTASAEEHQCRFQGRRCLYRLLYRTSQIPWM